jgi:hypothetical protein
MRAARRLSAAAAHAPTHTPRETRERERELSSRRGAANPKPLTCHHVTRSPGTTTAPSTAIVPTLSSQPALALTCVVSEDASHLGVAHAVEPPVLDSGRSLVRFADGRRVGCYRARRVVHLHPPRTALRHGAHSSWQPFHSGACAGHQQAPSLLHAPTQRRDSPRCSAAPTGSRPPPSNYGTWTPHPPAPGSCPSDGSCQVCCARSRSAGCEFRSRRGRRSAEPPPYPTPAPAVRHHTHQQVSQSPTPHPLWAAVGRVR